MIVMIVMIMMIVMIVMIAMTMMAMLMTTMMILDDDGTSFAHDIHSLEVSVNDAVLMQVLDTQTQLVKHIPYKPFI